MNNDARIYCTRLNQLKSARASFESHWAECYRFGAPERQQSFSNGDVKNQREAERATFKAGSVTWKKAKDSISLDSKALLKQYPEYLNQFPQSKSGSRRFNIYVEDE